MKRLLFITIILACAASASATTFVVNSLVDPGVGTCDVAECTLREAMNAANANPGADTITFSVSGTIYLDTGSFTLFPIVTSDMTIDAAGRPSRSTAATGGCSRTSTSARR